MKTIGSFLRAYRKGKKKTLKDVASAIDVSSSYISQIEKGIRNPSDKTLENILINVFDLRPTEADLTIREWRVKQYGGEVFGKTLSLKASDKDHPEKLPYGAFWFDELPLLPFYKNISDNFENDKPETHWPFPIEDPQLMKRLFIWQMDNDSMEPIIPEDAILVIDRNIEDIPYKTTVLAVVDGKPLLRYYEKRDDKTKLVPANNNYPVFYGENVIIIGRVVKMLVDV